MPANTVTISPSVSSIVHAAPIHLRINAAQAVGRLALCGAVDYVQGSRKQKGRRKKHA